jgi:hypothetical protein
MLEICISEDYVGFLPDFDVDVVLPQQFEESCEQRGEFCAIDGAVAVDVEQVKQVLDVVLSRSLSAHEVDDRLHDRRELTLVETVIAVRVELAEDLLD